MCDTDRVQFVSMRDINSVIMQAIRIVIKQSHTVCAQAFILIKNVIQTTVKMARDLHLLLLDTKLLVKR